MTMSTTYVGIDVHAATIWVAMLQPGAGQPEEWQLANEPRALRRLARRLKRTAPGPVVACYEAGPCGFALQRRLQAEGIDCQVIAPSLIPSRPGDRVKTDRRDARKLAELLGAGLLTVVHAPSRPGSGAGSLPGAGGRGGGPHAGTPPLGEAADPPGHRLRWSPLDAGPSPLAPNPAFPTRCCPGHL